MASVPVPDRFASARYKVRRARKHLRDFEREVGLFLTKNVYTVVFDEKSKPGSCVAKIASINTAGLDQLALTAGDVIHNLRSALDHFMFEVSGGATLTAQEWKKIYFPIYGKDDQPSIKDIHELVTRKTKGISARLFTALCALEAYKGGAGHDIWALNELDNADKHRLVLDIHLAGRRIIVTSKARRKTAPPEQRNGFIVVGNHDSPLQVGDVIMTVPIGTYDKRYKPRLPLQVRLSEPEILPGADIKTALAHLTDEVERLLERLIPLV